MSVTFKDLENFLVVSQSRTLSEASEKLQMAQPSLSLAIKKLEKELNLPLFIRGRNGIKLTPQGRTILPEAQRAIQILLKLKGAPTKLHFKIGCHPSVGMYILGKFLKSIHQYSHILDLTIVNGTSSEINKRVALGEIDFGLIINPLPIPGLITKIIGADEVAVWNSNKRYSDCLIYNPELVQSTSILSRWKNAPVKRIEVTNLELITHLVESGAGYGIIPTQVVRAQKSQLILLSDAPTFKDKLSLVCFPEIIKSKEGRLIFEELKKSFVST